MLLKKNLMESRVDKVFILNSLISEELLSIYEMSGVFIRRSIQYTRFFYTTSFRSNSDI